MKNILYGIEQFTGKISRSLAVNRIMKTPTTNWLQKVYQKFDLARAKMWPIQR